MEQITFETTRSGETGASIGLVRIHSSYNPSLEAERFLEARLEEIRPRAVVIIIGAGLGYLDRELKKKRPESEIIAIHLEEKLYHRRIDNHSIPDSVKRWHPGMMKTIEEFLFESLSETAIAGLKIIEWPASVKVRPQQTRQSTEALAMVIRRYSGNISTTAAFGRKWISNSLRNYLNLNRVIHPVISTDPVVLAAAGPSLEKSLTVLAEYRNNYQLWALPSSLPALSAAGLQPDMIITADPGYWARLHIRNFPETVPVAMPLSAAPGLRESTATLILPQGIPGENFLLRNGKWPGLQVQAMGTVAATAVEMWKQLTSGPLILTGLDLCWYDLRSHTRPHTFDGWLAAGSRRNNPMNNILWERAMKMAPKKSGVYRTGPAMQTYTDWFRRNIPSGRVFRLTPTDAEKSPVEIHGIPDYGPEIFRKLPMKEFTSTITTTTSPENRQQRQMNVKHLLSHWKILLKNADKGMDPETEELLYTLDPGGVLELKGCDRIQYNEIRKTQLKKVRSIINRMDALYG